MNVLIVDDDRFVVAALKTGINWNKIGFNEVYTASNITDAKSLLETYPVHLLLSDIDMPNGSGLDLLSWLREKHNNIPTIFLTNYADFNYAQKAVELNSFHYYLKPIEYDKLTDIIIEATKQYSKTHAHTQKDYESFWQAFIRNNMPDTSVTLQEYFSYNNLPYTTNDYYIPIVFDLFPYYLTSNNTLKNRFLHNNDQTNYMKTTFTAVFADMINSGDVFWEYDQNLSRYIAVFKLVSNAIPSLLLMNCENFTELVSDQYHCSLSCYIGIPSKFDNFQENFSKLTAMITNKLDCSRQIVLLSDYVVPKDNFIPLDTNILKLLFENKEYSPFLEHCQQYLKQLSKNGTLHSLSITSFQIDIIQIFYTHLKSKGILANKLFHGDSYHLLSSRAKNSIKEMNTYLQYMLRVIEDHIEYSSSEESVVSSIKKYIDQHYTEEINSNDIANIFYIDSDYASKLFKKEYGVSLKSYIINKRIETAKELLSNSSIPVNIAASNVGYENYSYFTRLFKKVTGMTPIEYRNLSK